MAQITINTNVTTIELVLPLIFEQINWLKGYTGTEEDVKNLREFAIQLNEQKNN